MALVNTQKLIKSPAVFVVLGVLVFGFACAGLTSHTPMHGMSASTMASSTPDQQKCCNTTISKYISSLKDNLIVPPREVRDIFVLLALGLILIITLASSPLYRALTNREPTSFRLYAQKNPETALFNHLKIAFSQGTLNPKIY